MPDATIFDRMRWWGFARARRWWGRLALRLSFGLPTIWFHGWGTLSDPVVWWMPPDDYYPRFDQANRWYGSGIGQRLFWEWKSLRAAGWFR